MDINEAYTGLVILLFVIITFFVFKGKKRVELKPKERKVCKQRARRIRELLKKDKKADF